MWDYVGMARSKSGLKKALKLIPEIREEFWHDACFRSGSGGDIFGNGRHGNHGFRSGGHFISLFCLRFGCGFINDGCGCFAAIEIVDAKIVVPDKFHVPQLLLPDIVIDDGHLLHQQYFHDRRCTAFGDHDIRSIQKLIHKIDERKHLK